MSLVEEARDLLCGGCGYNLRGVPESSDRCSECGRRFDRNHLQANLVPWEQRKAIGRVKAFFKTVWMGTVNVRGPAEKAKWPVSGRDAWWFRAIVLLLAVATMVPGAIWWWNEARIQQPKIIMPGQIRGEAAAWIFLLNPYSFGVLIASLVLWLIASACVVTSFFYDKRLSESEQKRAMALSRYTTAALAWLPIGFPIGAWIFAMSSMMRSDSPLPVLGNGLQIISWLALVVQVISWMRWRRGLSLHVGGRVRLIAFILTGLLMGTGYVLVWREWGEWNRPIYLLQSGLVPGLLAILMIGGAMLLFWVNVLRLMRSATGARGMRLVRAGAGIIVMWGLLGVMVVGTTQAVAVMGQILWAAW